MSVLYETVVSGVACFEAPGPRMLLVVRSETAYDHGSKVEMIGMCMGNTARLMIIVSVILSNKLAVMI